MLFLGKGIPLENQCLFQDSYTHFSTLIVNVHHIIWCFATGIAIFVCWLLFIIVWEFKLENYAKFGFQSHKNNEISVSSCDVTDKGRIRFFITDQYINSDAVIQFVCKQIDKISSYINPIIKTEWRMEIPLLISKGSKQLPWLKTLPPINPKKEDYRKYAIETSMKFNHGDMIEFLWLLGPCIILVLIAIPSFCILLSLKVEYTPFVDIKVIGNQWYWTYEAISHPIGWSDDTIHPYIYKTIIHDWEDNKIRNRLVDAVRAQEAKKFINFADRPKVQQLYEGMQHLFLYFTWTDLDWGLDATKGEVQIATELFSIDIYEDLYFGESSLPEVNKGNYYKQIIKFGKKGLLLNDTAIAQIESDFYVDLHHPIEHFDKKGGCYNYFNDVLRRVEFCIKHPEAQYRTLYYHYINPVCLWFFDEKIPNHDITSKELKKGTLWYNILFKWWPRHFYSKDLFPEMYKPEITHLVKYNHMINCNPPILNGKEFSPAIEIRPELQLVDYEFELDECKLFTKTRELYGFDLNKVFDIAGKDDAIEHEYIIQPLQFDSYMVPEEDLNLGDYRLLEVDYPLDIVSKHMYRVFITSNDVLHSWAIPSLGIKMDAVPGRLNQLYLYVFGTGIFYGQCSELCGVNHGFMPIVVRVTKPWLCYIE